MKLPLGDQISDDARYPGKIATVWSPASVGGSIVRCAPSVSLRGQRSTATTNELHWIDTPYARCPRYDKEAD